jgi:hypothetical protein
LSKGLIVDFGLPCDLVDVARSGSEWQISVKDGRRRVPRLTVVDAAPPSMRGSVKMHLEALLNA